MRFLLAAVVSVLILAPVFAADGAFVRGTVRGADGKAIRGADVLVAVKAWPGGQFRITPHHTKTDGDGRYDLRVFDDPKGRYHVNLAVLAAGHAFESRYASNPGDLTFDPKLTAAHPVTVRLMNGQGKPMSGARVTPSARKTPAGVEHLVYPHGADRFAKTANSKGELPVDWFATGDHATLRVMHAGEDHRMEFDVAGKKNAVIVVAPRKPMPQETLSAGKDENKRFILLGPKPADAAPKNGYGLILVLPGGTGNADFAPFVKSIYEQSAPAGYVMAQLVAIQWTPEQRIVWPTHRDKVKGAKFTTEEFIDAVVKDVSKRLKVDREKVLTLSWSSGGPAAYAAALRKRTPITGSFVTMSVFYKNWYSSLKPAKGKPFYILHSPSDPTCKFALAEDARDRLSKVGAKVEFKSYEGGHGWPPKTRFALLTEGFRWLDERVGGK